MEFNNAAQTWWGILGDQLSMTSPQDKWLPCLPESHRLEARETLDLSLSKGGWTKEGNAVILSDSNYHIPTASKQGNSTHWFSQQEPAGRKIGRKLWKSSSFFLLKFIDGHPMKCRPYVTFLLPFLDSFLFVVVFAWGSNEFRTLRHPCDPKAACS